MKKTKKILFYSHDTFGLGHIRRTQKIANKIANNDRSILIACASPKASSFMSAGGIEYLNLPGFTKQKSGTYIPRSLNIPTDEFVNLRATLLLSAVRAFNPDLLIIDKEPLGVKRELLPSLEYLKKHRKNCSIICGYRDILDEADAVFKEWKNRDTIEALKSYFHHIFIYGQKDIFDFAKNYHLEDSLAEKLIYTDYISFNDQGLCDAQWKFEDENKPLVTFTLGGGGDGWEFLECYLDLLEKEDKQHQEFNTFVLTGPFAHPDLITRAKKLSQENPHILASDFIDSTPTLFTQSDLIISMGGYNTFCELMTLGKHPLILPRIIPRKEQLIRAQVFQNKGLCDYLHPDSISVKSLKEKMTEMLKSTKRNNRNDENFGNGLDNVSKWIDQWLN